MSSSNTTPSSSSLRPASGHNTPWVGIHPSLLSSGFTAEMRDRQARGKDPYDSSSDDGGDAIDELFGGRNADRVPKVRLAGGRADKGKESFEKTEKRDFAATVLDNPELLMMFAQSSGDSIPATRLRFMKLMCGYDDNDKENDQRGTAAAAAAAAAASSRYGSPSNRARGGDRAPGSR